MSTVQFNLLPDVKMTYVKAQRSQKLVISVSIIASAAAIGLFIVLFFSVNVVQKKMLNDANNDIASYTKQLKSVPNIDQVLTIQNQLLSLTTLHQGKHITSRIFDYLPQILPPNTVPTQVNLDMATNTILITGKADSQYTVNKLIDTLRFAEYKLGTELGKEKAFSKPTETSLAISGGVATFTVTAEFNPILFSNSNVDSDGKPITPVIFVPDLTTTHAGSGSSNTNNKQGSQ